MYYRQKRLVSIAAITALFLLLFNSTPDVYAAALSTFKISVNKPIEGGSISPYKSTGIPVKQGRDKLFIIKPLTGWHVASVLVNDMDIMDTLTPQGKVYRYKFPQVSDNNQKITATFAKDTYTLTVNVTGTGSITSSPEGLTCTDSQCTGSFEFNTAVTLSPSAGENYEFYKWQGCRKKNSSQCTLTIRKNTTIAAKFEESEETSDGDSITIKGSFSGDASKVIVFSTSGLYWTSAITNSNFSLEVEKDQPAGMIFTDENNDYLGYLSLKNGIASLPLTKPGTGVTTIDLKELSANGQVVESDYNPLETELPLTAEEQTIMAHVDDLFVSVIKDPDVDNDGKFDFLSGKFYKAHINYFIKGGNFGSGLAPSVTTPANIDGYRFFIDVNDNNAGFPGTVYFTGPQGSQLSGSPNESSHISEKSASYGSTYISDEKTPRAGKYTVIYKTKTLTFDIPDRSSAPSNIIMAVPTVTLNDDGTIQKVSWNYMLGSGTGAIVDPGAIIDAIELQIDGSGIFCAGYQEQGRVYNSGNLPVTTTEHTPACKSLKWSDISRIYMAYTDFFGNHNVVAWDK